MADNMRFYNAGREVPAEAQKQFSNGKFSGTDINPMWRIKKLTELFGPAGIGWYVDNVTERCEEHNGVTMAIVNLELHVKDGDEWSKPIYGTGGNVLVSTKGNTSDEGYKMAFTDALSIACKSLGIGADIWFSQDKTKYTAKSEAAPVTVMTKGKPVDDDLPFTMNEPPKEVSFVCTNCGNVLKPYKDANGKEVGIRQHAAASHGKFGQTLCLDCIKKLYPDSVKA